MTLLDTILLFASNYVMVFLLGFQSKNVQHSKYALAGATSMGITLANFIFVKFAAGDGHALHFLLTAGAGGSLGIMSAIWVHGLLHNRKSKAKKSMHKVIYLAGPYSHDNKTIQKARFTALTRKAAELTNTGVNVFSPITHGHPMAEAHELPRDYAFWKQHCEAFVSRCDEMLVLMLEGWEESKGVEAEVKLAEELGIPVRFVALEG